MNILGVSGTNSFHASRPRLATEQVFGPAGNRLPRRSTEEELQRWETGSENTDAALNHAPVTIQCCVSLSHLLEFCGHTDTQSGQTDEIILWIGRLLDKAS